MCQRLPAHVSACDIFLLPSCLPPFVLSGVNKVFVLHILCSCFSGSTSNLTEKAVFGIKGLRIQDDSDADYHVKKCTCVQYQSVKRKR